MRAVFLPLATFILFTGIAFADETPAPDDGIVGAWHVLTEFRGQEMTSKITIAKGEDGSLSGTYLDSRGGTSELEELTFADGTLTFVRKAGQRSIRFEGKLADGRIEGHHLMGRQRIPATGVKGKDAFDKMLVDRRKANERGDDAEKDYDRHKRRVVKRDAFPVLFDPELKPAAEAKGIRDDEPVIGIAINGEAKAYPISIMGVHELANDTCGGEPIASSW